MIADKDTSGFVGLLKRPEIVTFIVALLVQVAAFLGLPERAGLALPEPALQAAVSAFWAVFVAAVFERQFKGADYVGGFQALLGSFKFRSAAAALLVVVGTALFKLIGVELPEAQVLAIVNFLIAAILGKGVVDGANAFGWSNPEVEASEIDLR